MTKPTVEEKYDWLITNLGRLIIETGIDSQSGKRVAFMLRVNNDVGNVTKDSVDKAVMNAMVNNK